jgi:hypothetical protein
MLRALGEPILLLGRETCERVYARKWFGATVHLVRVNRYTAAAAAAAAVAMRGGVGSSGTCSNGSSSCKLQYSKWD